MSAQTQDNILCPLRICVSGVDNRAISNVSSKLSLVLSSKAQSVANTGAQAIGADQQIGLVASLGPVTRQRDRKTTSMIGKVEDCRAKRQFDARVAANGVEQRPVQISAMNDEVRRAPAGLGVIERHSHKFAIIRTPQYDERVGPRGEPQHALEHAKLR